MKLTFSLTLCATILLSSFSFAGAQTAPTPVDKKAGKAAREKAKKEEKEALQKELAKNRYFVVTSEPSGARIELNGEYFGTTPYKQEIKTNYFYFGPRYGFSTYISSPWRLTVSKEGHVATSMIITKGPFWWVSMDESKRLMYYTVAYNQLHFKLDPVGEFLGTNPFNKSVSGETATAKTAGLSTEQIVQKAMPAVVTVKTPSGSGSGFFILESGVIVTNRHVVDSHNTASIVTAKGESIPAKSIFIHPNKDLALIKIDGGPFPFIPIADPSQVNVGADVIAIGSPGVGGTALQNSVTKGILSAFRGTTNNGLFAQTDAALNHGNSGGPLLNNRGEVIGVNTLGYVDFNKEGLNFALFCSEILAMLKEHFNYTPEFKTESKAVATSEPARIPVQITSEPLGAEIYVNEKLVGSTPSKISLPPGEHTIKIVRPGHKEWIRKVTIENGSEPTFNAILTADSVSPAVFKKP